MGADNLINFHKWYKCNNIIKKTKLIVFDRHGYKKRSLNSKTYKGTNEKKVSFIEVNHRPRLYGFSKYNTISRLIWGIRDIIRVIIIIRRFKRNRA